MPAVTAAAAIQTRQFDFFLKIAKFVTPFIDEDGPVQPIPDVLLKLI